MGSAHSRPRLSCKDGARTARRGSVVGVSLERAVPCSESAEGSWKGGRAWAGATMDYCPKIISFCNPVHFFLGTIQYFFLSGFSCLTTLCLESRALELICIPHPPLARGQERGQGTGWDTQLTRRKIPGPGDTSGGRAAVSGGLWGVLCSVQPEPERPLPMLPVGIYGVGKAALHPPALAVLSHTPDGATQTIAWVGKGIVYDTGGLSIKGKVRCWGQRSGGPRVRGI